MNSEPPSSPPAAGTEAPTGSPAPPPLVPAAPDLMPSLRHLVRGLSALFWGLPITLLVCVQSTVTEWLRPLGWVTPVLATGLLGYGILQLRYFQREERPWQIALERATLFALVNFALSPFIFFFNRLPGERLFLYMVVLMGGMCLLFLYQFNRVLRRLAAMLPDETLRSDTRLFTTLNLSLMISTVVIVLVYFGLEEIETLPVMMITFLALIHDVRHLLLVLLILLPVAMTMSLIWKVKEVVLNSVFAPGGGPR